MSADTLAPTPVPQAVTQLGSRIGDSLESDQKNWIRQAERRETASDTHASPRSSLCEASLPYGGKHRGSGLDPPTQQQL